MFNEVVDNYEQRLTRILATVPDVDSDQWWCNFEIANLIKGCDNTCPPVNISDYDNKIADINEFLPLVTHYYYNLECYEKHLGPGIRIKVTPDIKFIDTAIRIKWQNTLACPNPMLDLSEFHSWENSIKKFNFDIVIDDFDPLNQQRFAGHLNTILAYLKIQPDQLAIDQYLARYRNYHFEKINQLGLTSYYQNNA